MGVRSQEELASKNINKDEAMEVEVSLGQPGDWTFGVNSCRGADENGEFSMLTIGIGLFAISFIKHEDHA